MEKGEHTPMDALIRAIRAVFNDTITKARSTQGFDTAQLEHHKRHFDALAAEVDTNQSYHGGRHHISGRITATLRSLARTLTKTRDSLLGHRHRPARDFFDEDLMNDRKVLPHELLHNMTTDISLLESLLEEAQGQGQVLPEVAGHRGG